MFKAEGDITVLKQNVTVKDYMEDIITRKELEDSFYVMDLGVLLNQVKLWKTCLPRIQPFYAVKCNDSNLLLETLCTLGVFFDCASEDEIRKALKAGAKPNEVIYANPTKPINHIKYASSRRVSLMTFDSTCELLKVQKHFPSAKLLLRIRVDASEGSCAISLGEKFGCHPSSALGLIKYAGSLGLEVVGISFHVGTGCHDSEAHARGIHTASEIFVKAKKEGLHLKYLDIGGGYPGDSINMFKTISDSINEALRMEAEVYKDVTLIAEPGRFFGCNVFTLATCIISLKETESSNIYIINNGIYTSFNCVPTEKSTLHPLPLQIKYGRSKKTVVWGQTMEEFDKVVEECWLPEMKIGDWLYFTSMGAYSTCLSNHFYGYSIPKVYPVIHEEEWLELSKIKNQVH